MSRRLIGNLVIAIGVAGLSLVLLAGFYLDDRRVAPFYWLRFEFSPSAQKTNVLEFEEVDRPAVVYSFQKGNSGAFVNVELLAGTNQIVKLGGDERTFFGFKDVDGDDAHELLFTSASSYGTGRSVWKYDHGKWIEIIPAGPATRIFDIAEFMFYGPLVLFVALLLLLLGLLIRFKSRKRGGKGMKEIGHAQTMVN
jgi:hypothetical protein